MTKIDNVLNEHIQFFEKEENINKYEEFKDGILKEYDKKFSIKNLFSQGILYSIQKQIFRKLKTLIEYNKMFNDLDSNKKFNIVEIHQYDSSLYEFINVLLENNIKQDTLNIKINDISLFYNKISQIEKEKVDKLKENIKNIHFSIDFNRQNQIEDDQEKYEYFKTLFFKESQFIINYTISKDNYEDHQEDIIGLYENSKNMFRFYKILFDYNSLKTLTLDEMNSFKYYNSFLQRWINSTNQTQKKFKSYNGFQLVPINIFNNTIKSSLFIDENNNVYIDEKFQDNNSNKLFNFIDDKDKNGEDIPYYQMSLLYQQLIMNEMSFIRNFSKENQPLIFDQLDYYYNFTENSSIQNLSQEVEFLHQTVLRNLYNISWNWGNK